MINVPNKLQQCLLDQVTVGGLSPRKFPSQSFSTARGPAGWSGQSGKELVLAAPFLHPEMAPQAMEVGRSGRGGL
jgi:hypothetical protein